MVQIERFFRQSRMLLRQSRTLFRHCCRFWQQSRTNFASFRQSRTNQTCSVFWQRVERSSNKLLSKQRCGRLCRLCGKLPTSSRALLLIYCYGAKASLVALDLDRRVTLLSFRHIAGFIDVTATVGCILRLNIVVQTYSSFDDMFYRHQIAGSSKHLSLRCKNAKGILDHSMGTG